MKKTLIYFTAIAIAIFLSGNVYSQSSFSLHAGPSFPLSDFGDDDVDDEDSGNAGLGLSLGGKYLYPLNDKGFGLYIEADINYNGLKSSAKDDLEDMWDADDIKFYSYINVPVIAGLNYTFKANDQISLFGNFGIGPDFLKVTNMTIESDGEKAEMSMKLSTQLAYKIGGGLVVNDKYIVGLNYCGLGEHKLKGEVEWDGDSEEIDDFKLKVSLLTLTLGIKF